MNKALFSKGKKYLALVIVGMMVYSSMENLSAFTISKASAAEVPSMVMTLNPISGNCAPGDIISGNADLYTHGDNNGHAATFTVSVTTGGVTIVGTSSGGVSGYITSGDHTIIRGTVTVHHGGATFDISCVSNGPFTITGTINDGSSGAGTPPSELTVIGQVGPSTPVCGNSITEAGEDCDHGELNGTFGNSCDGSCHNVVIPPPPPPPPGNGSGRRRVPTCLDGTAAPNGDVTQCPEFQPTTVTETHPAATAQTECPLVSNEVLDQIQKNELAKLIGLPAEDYGNSLGDLFMSYLIGANVDFSAPQETPSLSDVIGVAGDLGGPVDELM